MLSLRLLGGAAVLILISTGSFAFQEQQATTPRQPETQQVQPAAAPLSADPIPASKGTTVRIPGLGTLGVIPKMDFGLELLYGAADQQGKRPDPSKTEQDDVLVGGRIKHKF